MTAAQPLVTVICPTFNSKAALRCALRSVLNQDLTDLEVRVVGDGCTDGSEDVVVALNDPRLLWFNLPKNTGSQSEPNNEGLRRARGKYVAFIGHDDLWFPWHLSRLVEHIEQTGADLVHDLVANVGRTVIEGAYGPPHGRNGYARVYFPTASWLHRRELPEEIGFWRQPDELGWAIDFDFSRRVARAGKKISFLPSLGVLKFHSIIWKTYAWEGERPQEEYLRNILEAPGPFSEKILSELAAHYAQNSTGSDKKSFGQACEDAGCAFKGTAKAAIRELVYLYGEERWPVGPLLRRRMKRLRRKLFAARGLER